MPKNDKQIVLERSWSHWARKKRQLLYELEKIEETLKIYESLIDSEKKILACETPRAE